MLISSPLRFFTDKSIRTLCLTLCFMVISGCTMNSLAGNKFNTSGLITEQRALSGFSQVQLKGRADVAIREGKSFFVSISAPERLMPLLKATVKGDRLILTSEGLPKSSLFRKNRVFFTVVMPKVTGISLHGAGDIDVDSVATDNLAIHVYGAGDIIVDRVKAQFLDVDLFGAGDVTIKSASVITGDVAIGGAGDIELSGEVKQLKIDVAGVGDFDGDDLVVDSVTASAAGLGDITIKKARVKKTSKSGLSDINIGG